MEWNKGLTGQSLEIASSNENRIRVMAGPGTGKTFTLMRRIARLIQEEVSPESILLVTFTRTAANDLKQELQNLNIPEVTQIHAGTLHSLCFKILINRNVIEIIGRNARPLYNFELTYIIQDLKHFSKLNIRKIKSQIKLFEAAWAKLQSEQTGWPSNKEDKIFQNTLIDYLKFHNAMIIGEVIPETLKYLRNNPNAKERKLFKYIFVDEYQDLNKAEQEIINVLAINNNLMIIGDEDQSIYENFRYAHPEGIRLFNTIHPETITYTLSACRRCPIKIVEAANYFIKNNIDRPDWELIPKPDNPQGTIHSVQWPTIESESKGIVDYIKYKINNGVKPGDIIVLCPRRQIGYLLKEKLLSSQIEALSFFTEEIFDDPNAKMAFSIISLLLNKYDRVALRCWLSQESKTYNVGGYLELKKYCEINKKEPFDVLEELLNGSIQLKYSNNLNKLYSDLKQLISRLHNVKLTEIINEIYPQDQKWAEPFREMLQELNDFDHSAKDIYSIISSNIINPDVPLNSNNVRIMSLQKSKGLTAQICIICALNEGLIPSYNKTLSGKEAQRFIEEQRRLFFVGITRCKQELVLSNVSLMPKSIAYNMGLKVQNTLSSDLNLIASTFLSQLGPNFPLPILGSDWKYL